MLFYIKKSTLLLDKSMFLCYNTCINTKKGLNMIRRELRDFILAGKTQAEIARNTGNSRQYISECVKKWGLSRTYQTVRDEKKFKAIEDRRKKYGCKDSIDAVLYSEYLRRFRIKKANAKRKGIPFDLHFTEVIWNTHCPLTGIKLDYFTNKGPAAPSFDRRDNTKGYVTGNVWIISRNANSRKRDKNIF